MTPSRHIYTLLCIYREDGLIYTDRGQPGIRMTPLRHIAHCFAYIQQIYTNGLIYANRGKPGELMTLLRHICTFLCIYTAYTYGLIYANRGKPGAHMTVLRHICRLLCIYSEDGLIYTDRGQPGIRMTLLRHICTLLCIYTADMHQQPHICKQRQTRWAYDIIKAHMHITLHIYSRYAPTASYMQREANRVYKWHL